MRVDDMGIWQRLWSSEKTGVSVVSEEPVMVTPNITPPLRHDWLALVTRERRLLPDGREDASRDWYAIDPDITYPKVIDYIQKIVAGIEPQPPCITIYMHPARELTAEAWQLALLSREECEENNVALRSTAIELVRLTLTALIREQNGRAIGVHILKGSGRWRL